ncbi:MAG: MFS transporter [Anaerolineae bacterium]|nr:MFS transporter [Anaerolineae bacterium]
MSQAPRQENNWKIPFFTIWSGQQLSWIGSALAGFALVWWVTETTGSATILATATLVSMLPGVLLGPFVGALVDRWNRRAVMLVADGFVAMVSAWLAFLFWTDAIQIWHVYVIMLARAIGGAFHWSAMTASTSLMVPKEQLPRVAGLNQTMGGAVNIISPPLGALLLTMLPLHGIMALDVITAAFAIIPLFFIAVPQPERKAQADETKAGKPSLWQDVREGMHYIAGWPGLLAICILAMFLNLLISPAMSLLPILVTKHFGGQAGQLAWLNSAWGIGLVLGGLILSVWGGFKRRIVTMLTGIIGLGAGALLVGLTPSTAFPLAAAGLFFGAIMNSLCNGSAFALLQSVIAPDMQGRVFTVVMSLCNAMTPLGMVIAGPAADAFGVRALYVVGGIAQVLLGIGGFFVPAIMHLEDNNGHCQPVQEPQPEPVPMPLGAEAS